MYLMHNMTRGIVKLAQLGVMGVLLLSAVVVASPGVLAQAGGAGATHATADLQHTPRGTASLHWQASNEELTVTITLFGLAPSSTHPAHIHAGDCDDNGPIIYPLNNVVANAAGDAHVTTVIPDVENGI